MVSLMATERCLANSIPRMIPGRSPSEPSSDPRGDQPLSYELIQSLCLPDPGSIPLRTTPETFDSEESIID